jgi:RNA polymerase sigma-70 factor (ECF subfamily)
VIDAAASHDDEARLVEALRRSDEAAFAELVERYHASLVRVAATFVGSRAVAEEVAQETWLGVLRGIDRFEGRSSLKTWLFRILANTARTRAVREGRTVPFSALGGEAGSRGPTVDADRFRALDDPRWPGHWAAPPSRWDAVPESRLLGREALDLVEASIAGLPPAQRRVITMRDVQGLSAEETCSLLELTEVNQRVLLHRARARVRAALEEYLR